MKEKKQTYINKKEDTLLNSIYNFKKDLSKKTIKNYIKNNMIKVNNKIISNSSTIIKENATVEISYNKQNTNFNLDILYEDEYLIAINKPNGLLSISNNTEKNITAYRTVSDYVKEKEHKFIFVVHRLDEETSGILLFSKNQKIRDKMQENWNTITKKRGYIALIDGLINKKGTFKSYLKEDHNQFVHSTKSQDGKLAITNYELLKTYNNISLVQVFIETGRRNQIRVHFKENKTPIIGDKKYGSKNNIIKRLCLHANILEFIHPVTKKIIHIETDLPEEFNKIKTNK